MSRLREARPRDRRWDQLRGATARLCAMAMLAAGCAGLARAGAPDPASNTSQTAVQPSSAEIELLWESRRALFIAGNPAEARRRAAAALQIAPSGDLETRTEALFVEMEAAVLQQDEAGVTSAAAQLCGLGSERHGDPRIQVASFRLANSRNRMVPLQQVPAAHDQSLQFSLFPLSDSPSTPQRPSRNASAELEHRPPCQTRREAA